MVSIFISLKTCGKKLKKYGLIKLSKQESIRCQIVNIISLLMIPQDEINHCMEQIIDELCNVESKFDTLTHNILNNYIEDARFPLHIWNHFDSLGERLRTNNYLEGYHRQLNVRVQTNPGLWTWTYEVRLSEESDMHRYEQE